MSKSLQQKWQFMQRANDCTLVLVERFLPGPMIKATTIGMMLAANNPAGKAINIRLIYSWALLLRIRRPMLVVMAANRMGSTHIFSNPRYKVPMGASSVATVG